MLEFPQVFVRQILARFFGPRVAVTESGKDATGLRWVLDHKRISFVESGQAAADFSARIGCSFFTVEALIAFPNTGLARFRGLTLADF